MTTATEIATMLADRYPAFASVDSARLELFAEDAEKLAPLCKLPASLRDLAWMYKTASLASASPDLTATLAAGSVKRMKDGDVEIEYQATGVSHSVSSANPYEAQYQALVRPYARNSPRVLGFRG